MLKACMIDGFGWFERADYRRAWLFFDEVEYVLPRETTPPLVYLPQVYDSPQHRVVHAELDDDRRQVLIERALFDSRSPAIRAQVESIPGRDKAYALSVVRYDRQLGPHLPGRVADDPAFALSLLLNKLILHAASSGAVPIFGRRYAAELLATKLEVWRAERAQAAEPAPATPRASLAYTAFTAGLSLGFVPDALLEGADFALLLAFKDHNRELLERHQQHLLGVAERFRGLPSGERFEEKLDELRAEVSRERAQLEAQAREAWRRAGSEIAKGTLVATSTALVTGLAVLRGFSLVELLAAAVPAAAAGVGTAAASTLEALRRARGTRAHDLAYLFEAQAWLRASARALPAPKR